MSPEHREYAEVLLRKAREDPNASRVLAESEDLADDIVGFHLQQAVEKALKAVLVAEEIEIPRTHDIEEVSRLVAGTGLDLPESLASAEWLTPWGVAFRYDDQGDDLDFDAGLEAATAAIGLAEQILER